MLGSQNRASKLLTYLGDLAVNGSSIKGQIGEPKLKSEIIIPELYDDAGQKIDVSKPCTKGWRQVILEQGPKGFAKAIRANKGCLLMDTVSSQIPLRSHRSNTYPTRHGAMLTNLSSPHAFERSTYATSPRRQATHCPTFSAWSAGAELPLTWQ